MNQRLLDSFEFYLSHQEEFVEKYNGRVVALKDCKVLGDYEDQMTAITETAKTEPLGTFIVQKVSPGDQDYTITINSPWVVRPS
jgi:hypothetical protein